MALNLLRSAAGQGVGRFGAYVHHNFIPDERGYEVALSIMAVAGYGGSGYNSYIWGPHYAFTEYMWSEKFGHYEHVADANGEFRAFVNTIPILDTGRTEDCDYMR